MRSPLLCLFLLLWLSPARAAEPFLRKNEVIALVGGEDMVVTSEDGSLELLLTRALPDDHLRFRNLAWEGDTVYEQRRDVNFPTWEEQLDQIGATVVLCQFGQMESLDGKEKLPAFVAAYEALIKRFADGGKRRVALIEPHRFGMPKGAPPAPRTAAFEEYIGAIRGCGHRLQVLTIDFTEADGLLPGAAPHFARGETPRDILPLSRDLVHLNADGHFLFSRAMVRGLTGQSPGEVREDEVRRRDEQLRQLIVAKNQLWFHYWRVQNWAFLAGDRTNQPSSRDWRDPSKRWFPAEREEFLPLIEAKEKEIDALAEKLSTK